MNNISNSLVLKVDPRRLELHPSAFQAPVHTRYTRDPFRKTLLILISERYPTALQVVGGNLDSYTVRRKYTNSHFAHFSRNSTNYSVSIVQQNP